MNIITIIIGLIVGSFLGVFVYHYVYPGRSSVLTNAKKPYDTGLERVANTPEPKKQKFPIGTRVYIAKNLGSSMSHFTSDCKATVEYTYAHAYGGTDIDSYSLIIDGEGSSSWYHENQLTLLNRTKGKIFLDENETIAAIYIEGIVVDFEILIPIDKDTEGLYSEEELIECGWEKVINKDNNLTDRIMTNKQSSLEWDGKERNYFDF